MTSVVILLDTNNSYRDAAAYKTVRVCVMSAHPLYEEFDAVIRRVEFAKVPAMLDKFEAKYNVSPTSHHREQYELLAAARANMVSR